MIRSWSPLEVLFSQYGEKGCSIVTPTPSTRLGSVAIKCSTKSGIVHKDLLANASNRVSDPRHTWLTQAEMPNNKNTPNRPWCPVPDQERSHIVLPQNRNRGRQYLHHMDALTENQHSGLRKQRSLLSLDILHRTITFSQHECRSEKASNASFSCFLNEATRFKLILNLARRLFEPLITSFVTCITCNKTKSIRKMD